MTGALADYERLCMALAKFREADRGRDDAIAMLTRAAWDADPKSLVAPSTVAWAERRAKSFRASVQATIDELLTAVGEDR